MNVHVSIFDRECRKYGEPPRLYVNTKRWHLIIALHPRRGRSQTWNPWRGTTDHWGVISIRPSSDRLCREQPPGGGMVTCSRLAGHRQACSAIWWAR